MHVPFSPFENPTATPDRTGPLGEEAIIDSDDPRYWEIFFQIHSDLPREAPGDEASALRALGLVPPLPTNGRVLDLACGPGAATPLLARETGRWVVGLDLHAPFVRQLRRLAGPAGAEARVLGVHGDMESLPFPPGTFDLVWCEGALYNVGFPRGLEICRDVLKPGGHLAATEAVWLEDEPPEELRHWWEAEYPGIATITANMEMIERAGLTLLGHFTLPDSAWWNYYRPVETRLAALRERHGDDPLALEVLDEAQVEVDMFRRYGGSYGYEFFVCRTLPSA